MSKWGDNERGFSGTERYAVIRKIGSGGMGVVYEAEDLELRQPVAIKTLHRFEPDAVYRIKKEFRALDEVQHLNLVDRHALVEHEGAWFIVMELVDGIDIVRAVRQILDPSKRQDVLRSGFSQLAEGVGALHAHDKLHRDLKPSNVLFTTEGRTVLLDFGLVSAVGEEYFVRSTLEGRISGTAAYMSPEQAAGNRVQFETDIYGLGVMMFEALAGRLPFVGSVVEVIMNKQREDAPEPSSFASGVPADLAKLCMAMLDRRPEYRPTIEEIVSAMGKSPRQASQRKRRASAPSEHTHSAFRAWMQAVQGGGRLLWVEDTSPAGTESSVLMQSLAEKVGRPAERLIFPARARATEHVPFPGLDELVDGLARWLTLLPEREVRELMPTDADALVQLFPVMGRQAVLQRAASSEQPPGPSDVRGRAATALRDLVASASQKLPVLLMIDDLHHADVDTAELLHDVLAPGIPDSVLVVLGSRPAEAPPFLGALWRALSEGPVSVHLSRLELSGDFIDDEAATVAGTGTEYRLTRSGREGLDDLLEASLNVLPTPAFRLLRSIVLSERTLPAGLALATVADADQQTLVDLVEERLLVGTADPSALTDSEAATTTDVVQWVHADERVSRVVLRELPPDTKLMLHGVWAEVLAERGDLVEAAKHLRSAGAKARAHELAYKAAQRVFAQCAYSRAAELFGLAAELTPQTHRVWWQCVAWQAESLASSGRHPEAAARFQEAAAAAGAPRNFELIRRAGAQWFAAGDVNKAQEVLHPIATEVGLAIAQNTREAMKKLPMALFRARLKSSHWIPAEQVSRATRHELDLLWTLCSGMAFFAPARSFYYGQEFLRRVMGRGDAYRAARALACDVALRAGRTRKVPQERLDGLRDAVAAAGTPQATATRALALGLKCHLEGDWLPAFDYLESAFKTFAELGPETSWEKVATQRVIVEVCCYLGRHNAVRHYLKPGLALGASGNASPMLRVSRVIAWRFLFSDRTAEAQAEADYCVALVGQGLYPTLSWNQAAVEADVRLYEGRVAEARACVDRAWSEFEASHLGELYVTSAECWFLKLRCDIASAGMTLARLKAALRPMRTIISAQAEGQGLGYYHALASLVYRSQGDSAKEEQELRKARSAFAETGMELHAAVTSRRLCELKGDALDAIEEWFAAERFPRPDRLQAWLLPEPVDNS